MDRRAFLLLAFAGAANPGLGPQPPAPFPDQPPTQAGDPRFDAWAQDFVDRSIRAGWPAEVLRAQFQGLTPDPRVLALDSQQPEFAKPTGDYVKGAVSEARVEAGREKLAQSPWLFQIQARFGVPPEILVAIWAVETNFGAMQGDFDVLRSLATLAAEGRRREWAETQILALIRIIATGQATRAQLRGSWAGAMGQSQMEPDTYLTTAVSLSGSGPPDIWGSAQDALASAANLLAKAGWRAGEAWQREVVLPAGFDYSLAEAVTQSGSEWARLGLRPADGSPWDPRESPLQAVLLLPSGAMGPALLVFPNHFVIRQYNDSMAYALAVGLLAVRVAGGGPLITPWPPETPLSTAQRMGAQRSLAWAGFDPGAIDGVIGANTRAALRDWQKARGLIADGYLSMDMVERLQAEAPVPPPAPAPTSGPPGPASPPGGGNSAAAQTRN